MSLDFDAPIYDLKQEFVHELKIDPTEGIHIEQVPNGAHFMSLRALDSDGAFIPPEERKVSLFFHVLPNSWIDNEPVPVSREFFLVSIEDGSSFSFGRDRMGRSILTFLGTIETYRGVFHVFEVYKR